MTWFLAACFVSVTPSSPLAVARTPIAGFQPLVGIGLTDEFKDDTEATFFLADTSDTPGGSWLGSGGSPYFDLALLDTGAGASLITNHANLAFDIEGAGFGGTALQQITGASGAIFTRVEDPLGIYATGLGNRISTAPLQFNQATMRGQTSVSLLNLPPESKLPNILGLPFASQYKTSIRSDQPQLFSYGGRTVRTPNVSFGQLGTGAADGIVRRASLTLNPSNSFLTPPAYVFNFENIINNLPWTDNPTNPTVLQGGLFLNVGMTNQQRSIGPSQFFFDTGADVTVVSRANAVQLGFDPVLDEPDFSISILGSGGTLSSVPGFFVDQLSLVTEGGTFTANDVPVLALNVVDPTSPGNFVPGIVGTNVFTGRNIVIDPQPALSGSGPNLYISDPVTSVRQWNSMAASAAWQNPANWSTPGVPQSMWIANVYHVAGGVQEAVVTTNSTVWELNVRSNTADDMTVRIDPGAILTTFSGINIEDGGRLQLSGGRVDAQFVEVLGGALTGTGTIEIGNGPIIGQVEVRGGLIAPGNGLGTLTVSGNFSANSSSTFQFELGGNTPGTGYDRLVVDYDMSIDGTLEVLLRPGFSPRVGDAFTLISTGGTLGGNFDEWVFPAGYTWNVNLQPSSVILSVTGARSPGDVNSDGRVDGLDIGILFGAWGNSSGSADVTRDGIVDGADIALVFSHWTGEAGPVVPEPSWGPVLSLALGIDARRAGRRIA